MQNYQQTIISQYGDSPVMQAYIGLLNSAIDPAPLITAFYNDMFNVATATGYGLDVWGRIVGVGRVVALASGSFFGFSGGPGGSSSGTGFNQSPFYSIGAQTTSNYALSDTAFRQLIFAKALTNICNASVPSINSVLMLLFGQSVPFQGSISGTTLTISSIPNLGQVPINTTLSGIGVATGTKITAQTGGTPNGPGTYTVSISQVVAFETINASGAAYCTDGRNMTMTYTFSFTPTPVQLAIISQSGALPKPDGVSLSVVHP